MTDHRARDHGGDLDRAMRDFGGADWLDLSTGINPVPYPVPQIAPDIWGRLPTKTETAALAEAAQACYGTTLPCLPLAGAQAAIQLVPSLASAGQARVLGPTYNEHAAALRAQGWDVKEVPELEDLSGAGLAVVVTPNNPGGQMPVAQALLKLAGQVGHLVVDESFMDPTPEASLLGKDIPENLLVLRSFGKFFGLAGLRLGFALGHAPLIAPLRERAGPWAVSGPAIVVGRKALSDIAWQEDTRARLASDAARLDGLADKAGWSKVGGSALFGTFQTPDAAQTQTALARHHIWTRIFPYSETWIRLGHPEDAAGWARLAEAMAQL